MKKLIFITAGDPLGIGPEIVVKALKKLCLSLTSYQPIVIGDVPSLWQAGLDNTLAKLLPIDSITLPKDRAKAKPTKWGGEVSFNAFKLGCKLAKEYKAPLITAPISKQSWQLANIPYIGHTEYLRKFYGKDALMMFISGNLRCALITEHFAIKKLSSVITRQRIIHAATVFNSTLQKMGIKSPKIAVCALNPHAGDNGKFGTEELQTITPSILALQEKGLVIEGPFPADSLWSHYQHGFGYHGLLCMYHDQALLPLKLIAKEPIVHITAGLTITRVSPTHGTAFDIAGKNIADPSSMVSAIRFVIK